MNHSALDIELVPDKGPQPSTCPNAVNHTDGPSNYLDWHEWARNLAKTHKQTRCPDCKLFKIWTPLE